MLKLENLVKVYPPNHRALDGLSLETGEGVLGLLGPNGAGKSSLMEILSAGMDFQAGSVLLDGAIDVRRQPRKWRGLLGYLPQHFDFPPFMTGRELLRESLALHGRSISASRKRIDVLLERANLTDAADRYAASYSRGMKQRLGFILAVLHEPRLLLLDEPTAGLDPVERVFFRDLLADIATGRIVILSTHIVEDVEKCCHSLAVVNHGRLLFRATAADLLARALERVWEYPIEEEDVDTLAASRQTVSIRFAGGQFLARVISDAKPRHDAHMVPANMEDAYFELLEGQRPPATKTAGV